jgi:predicted lipid-binding transport protein (Tim44 family)
LLSADTADPVSDSGLLSADNKPSRHLASATSSEASGASNSTLPVVAPPPVPAPRHDRAADAAGESAPEPRGEERRLSRDDAVAAVRRLHAKMDAVVFAQGARAWLRILQEQHPDEYAALLRELLSQQ